MSAWKAALCYHIVLPSMQSSIYILHPAGSALCRHVQLCLQRGRLRTLLCHGEFCWCKWPRKDTVTGHMWISICVILLKIFVVDIYVLVPSVIRGPGRLPQEVSGSSGGSYTNYPNTARWLTLIKHVNITKNVFFGFKEAVRFVGWSAS